MAPSSKKVGSTLSVGGSLVLGGSLFFAILGMYVPLLLPIAGILFLAFSFLYPRSVLYTALLLHWVELMPVIGAKAESFKYAAGPINITLNDLVYGLMCLLVLSGLFKYPNKLNTIFNTFLGKALCAFVLYQFVQILYCLWGGVALDSIIRESSKYLVALYVLYVYFYYDTDAFKRMLNKAQYIVFTLPVFQIIMVATGEVWLTSSGTERTYYIGANLFFMAVIIYYVLQPKLRMSHIFIIVYMLAGMALTQYRSAFLALMAAMMLIAFYLFKDGRVDKVALGGMGLLFASILGIALLSIVKPDFVSQTVSRYADTFNTEDRNVSNRTYMWGVSYEAFKRNPVFGVGVAKSIYSYVDDGSYLSTKEWSPHNFIMRLAAKEGFLGVASLLAVLIGTYSLLMKRKKARIFNESERRMLMAMLVALLVVHTMNTTFTSAKSNFFHWMFTGYIVLQWWEARRLRIMQAVQMRAEQNA